MLYFFYYSGNTYNSVAQGGAVGNISVPHGRPAASGAVSPPVVAPQEGLTERTEHAAEGDYMKMEVTAFEPQAEKVASGEHGVVGGDAPSAGGGMQMAGDAFEERPPAQDF